MCVCVYGEAAADIEGTQVRSNYEAATAALSGPPTLLVPSKLYANGVVGTMVYRDAYMLE